MFIPFSYEHCPGAPGLSWGGVPAVPGTSWALLVPPLGSEPRAKSREFRRVLAETGTKEKVKSLKPCHASPISCMGGVTALTGLWPGVHSADDGGNGLLHAGEGRTRREDTA